MPGRHKGAATLTQVQIGMVEGGAKSLQYSTQRAREGLRPFSEHYQALMNLDDEIRIALNIIDGRPADHRGFAVTPGFMADLAKQR
ncbi:hypothetical protein [Mesorhizobium sp. IMUNJ 23232]|uniref:hypothetical protein n=1 Tax=Mesorhizobium sp. IMUNJ 23232 TaxID=3376064 RepID=UPI0037BA08F0